MGNIELVHRIELAEAARSILANSFDIFPYCTVERLIRTKHCLCQILDYIEVHREFYKAFVKIRQKMAKISKMRKTAQFSPDIDKNWPKDQF